MLAARLVTSFTLLPFLLLARACASTGTQQCAALSTLLPGKVSYPSNSSYTNSILSYFFLQEHLAPSCIVTPTSTSDVQIAVAALATIHAVTPSAVNLAIRSGGHSPVTGAANNNGGVTMDLRSLDSIVLNQAKTIVTVGAGTLWNATYAELDPLNLAVSGGRVAGIGTGGFLTGGTLSSCFHARDVRELKFLPAGISFFSPQRGWACDGVVGMEVVLANGEKVYASAQSYPDLFKALKGGSNNFGVVVSFDLQTFPQGDFFGGTRIFQIDTLSQQLQAFNTFMQPANFDEKATAISGYIYDGAIGAQLVSVEVEYSSPVSDPVALQPFLNISGAVQDTMRISTLLDFVTELAADEPLGTRYVTEEKS